MKVGMKQTKIGRVPEEWNVLSVGQFTDCTAGGTPSTLNKMYWEGGNIPWLSSGELNKRRIYSTDNYITEIGLRNSSTKLVNKDCVLIGLAGQGKTRGTVAINKIPLCTNQSIAAIFPSSIYSSQYLFYNLQSRYLELRSLSTGDGGRGGLNLTIIRKIEIPFPPLPEQQSIAEALDHADAWIESLETLIEKKRLIKQGAMQELLRPKKEWILTTFDEAFFFLRTASYSRADLKSDGYAGYIHYGDIHTKWNNILDVQKVKLPAVSEDMLKSYSLIKSGDLVMADASEDYSGVGKSIELILNKDQKIIAGLHTFLLRPKSNLFSPKFMGYLIHAPFIKNQLDTLATGLKVYSISKSALRQIQILYPSKEEQTRIANILFDIDAEIETLELKLNKARQIKQGMMQQLLTGKIRLLKPGSAKTFKSPKRAIV